MNNKRPGMTDTYKLIPLIIESKNLVYFMLGVKINCHGLKDHISDLSLLHNLNW